MRILLADDHKLVRSGIRRLLEDLPGIAVVGEADDGEQASEMARHSIPEIVLADISMPRMNGLELAAWLARHIPQTRVIVLSMHTAEDYVLQALAVGVRGYVLKQAASQEIVLAVEAVAAGKIYLSPAVAHYMVAALAKRPSEEGPATRRITPRQRQILKLVALGKSSKEIAALLGISPRTVDTHRADLMERLGARDVVGMLREAARLGLIDLTAGE